MEKEEDNFHLKYLNKANEKISIPIKKLILFWKLREEMTRLITNHGEIASISLKLVSYFRG